MRCSQTTKTNTAHAGDNIAVLPGEFGRQFGTAAAFRDQRSSVSYADLAASVSGVGVRIARRVRPGQRVALLAAPGPDWVVHFFAILHAGAVVVLLDPELTDGELARQIDASHARLLLVSQCQRHRARTLAAAGDCRLWRSFAELQCTRPVAGCTGPRPRRADDTAVIAFTSGTTGAAKGVRISHGNLRFQLAAFEHVVPGRVRRTLSILPPHHLFGLTVDLLGTLAQGACIEHCQSLLPVDIARSMRAARPTHMMVVPAFLEAVRCGITRRVAARSALVGRAFESLLVLARYLPVAWRPVLFPGIHRRLGGRLGCIICGGAPLADDTERFFWRLGIRVLVGYGMTETSPVVSFNRVGAHRSGSVGKPLPGVEVTIAADGGIQTRGPHVMRGYDDEPPRDAAAWLSTGDTGRFDEDGYLYVEGRANDLIVLGNGKKVHPDEVEGVLFASPLIAEGAVIGLPARGRTQEVCAVVVPTTNLRGCPTQASLQSLLQRTLGDAATAVAPFKRPTRVVVCDHPLPRTSTHKVKRAVLRAGLIDAGETPCPLH